MSLLINVDDPPPVRTQEEETKLQQTLDTLSRLTTIHWETAGGRTLTFKWNDFLHPSNRPVE